MSARKPVVTHYLWGMLTPPGPRGEIELLIGTLGHVPDEAEQIFRRRSANLIDPVGYRCVPVVLEAFEPGQMPWLPAPAVEVSPQILAAAHDIAEGRIPGPRGVVAEILLYTLVGAGLLALVLTAAAGLWPELLLLVTLSFFVGLAVSAVQALLRRVWRNRSEV